MNYKQIAVIVKIDGKQSPLFLLCMCKKGIKGHPPMIDSGG